MSILVIRTGEISGWDVGGGSLAKAGERNADRKMKLITMPEEYRRSRRKKMAGKSDWEKESVRLFQNGYSDNGIFHFFVTTGKSRRILFKTYRRYAFRIAQDIPCEYGKNFVWPT